MLNISHIRVFSLVWLFLFFTNNLYGNYIDRLLLRDISSQNQLVTEHFYIYWSDEYDYSYPWTAKIDGYPKYIDTLKKEAEEIYQSFLLDGFIMPERIELYIANTGIFADGLKTNSISSLGAFTSDDYPEILINANLTQKTLNSDIKRIVAHEMMHVVQFENKIILGEDSTPDTNKWFTEGTAVATEVYIMNDPKYLYEYFDDIINIEGFKSTNNYEFYGNGFLFYYLIKKYNYSLNDFINRYKLYSTFDSFISSIEKEQNLNKYELVSNVYNSFLYEKEMYGEGFKDINIGFTEYTNYILNITKGWQLISLPININDFSIFKDINHTIWGYKNNKWSCIDSNIDKNKICEDNNMLLKNIDKRDGFWLYSDINTNKELSIFK